MDLRGTSTEDTKKDRKAFFTHYVSELRLGFAARWTGIIGDWAINVVVVVTVGAQSLGKR